MRSRVDITVGARGAKAGRMVRRVENNAQNEPLGRDCCLEDEPHSITMLKIVTTNLLEHHLAIYKVTSHVLHFATASHSKGHWFRSANPSSCSHLKGSS